MMSHHWHNSDRWTAEIGAELRVTRERAMAAETSLDLWTAFWAMEKVIHVIPLGDSGGSSSGQSLTRVKYCMQLKRQIRPEDSWDRSVISASSVTSE